MIKVFSRFQFIVDVINVIYGFSYFRFVVLPFESVLASD